MYDKCYFCLDQLPKLKKESTASLLRKFWRSRGTKEPAYITVFHPYLVSCCDNSLYFLQDHIAEVFEKWNNIEDEIWAKVGIRC